VRALSIKKGRMACLPFLKVGREGKRGGASPETASISLWTKERGGASLPQTKLISPTGKKGRRQFFPLKGIHTPPQGTGGGKGHTTFLLSF